jgi:ribosome-binding factor A
LSAGIDRGPVLLIPPFDVSANNVSSRRQLKAAEAIREVVAMSILTDLRDPRVRDVTVLAVEVTADMREAKVSVSVMGDDTQQALSLRGLQNSAGFLQSKIADKIEARYIPKLHFVLDQGVKNVVAVGEILERIRQEKEAQQSGDSADRDNAPANSDGDSQVAGDASGADPPSPSR